MRSRIALLLVAAFAVTSTTGCKRIAEKIIKDKISEASDGGVTFNNDGTVTVKGNETGSSSGSSGSSGTTTTSRRSRPSWCGTKTTTATRCT